MNKETGEVLRANDFKVKLYNDLEQKMVEGKIKTNAQMRYLGEQSLGIYTMPCLKVQVEDMKGRIELAIYDISTGRIVGYEGENGNIEISDDYINYSINETGKFQGIENAAQKEVRNEILKQLGIDIERQRYKLTTDKEGKEKIASEKSGVKRAEEVSKGEQQEEKETRDFDEEEIKKDFEEDIGSVKEIAYVDMAMLNRASSQDFTKYARNAWVADVDGKKQVVGYNKETRKYEKVDGTRNEEIIDNQFTATVSKEGALDRRDKIKMNSRIGLEDKNTAIVLQTDRETNATAAYLCRTVRTPEGRNEYEYMATRMYEYRDTRPEESILRDSVKDKENNIAPNTRGDGDNSTLIEYYEDEIKAIQEQYGAGHVPTTAFIAVIEDWERASSTSVASPNNERERNAPYVRNIPPATKDKVLTMADNIAILKGEKEYGEPIKTGETEQKVRGPNTDSYA